VVGQSLVAHLDCFQEGDIVLQSEDNDSAQCPYCVSESDCEHLLLCVDTTFRTASGGKLYEAFDDTLTLRALAHEDDPDFDEAAEFDALLEAVDDLAGGTCEYVIEGMPGMTSAYISFYVATEKKMASACSLFKLRNRPKFRVAWADDDIVLELSLSERNWTKLRRGESLSVRGKGYRYEGEFYWDHWDFAGGLDGDLIVRYGSPKDRDYSAQGYVGKVSKAAQ
jgi:hypothetical protein